MACSLSPAKMDAARHLSDWAYRAIGENIDGGDALFMEFQESGRGWCQATSAPMSDGDIMIFLELGCFNPITVSSGITRRHHQF